MSSIQCRSWAPRPASVLPLQGSSVVDPRHSVIEFEMEDEKPKGPRPTVLNGHITYAAVLAGLKE